MRGLLKAAALLPALSASAPVVLRSLLVDHGEVPDFVIKYNQSEASVVFRVSEPIAPGLAIPPLEFRAGSTQKPCGESNIRLNGQKLSTEWEENHGLGSDFLDAFRFLPNVFTTWHITCLEGATSSTSGDSDGAGPVQVARFGIYNQNRGRSEAAGFAVSFRSSAKPEILRLVPVRTEDSDLLRHPDIWRTSSMTVTPQWSQTELEDSVHEAEEDSYLDGEDKSLKAHLQNLQSFLGTTFRKARETFQAWCPSNKQNTLGASHDDAPSAVEHEMVSTPTTANMGTSLHALPTRSASPEPASTIPSLGQSPHYTGLKIFGLVLILSSLVIWIVLRLRDPRLRADRAARREERRNKRLYRQAARQHKWKRWFCSWRHRDHRCTQVSTWDEKQDRVLKQEEVLEVVMREDIRKLRNEHRVENNIGVAEERRSIYVYDSDDSRRRSRETLPGYESEGTQPPSYDLGVNGDNMRVAEGFQYIPADREDTPDSSVISTSPRTTRDDRSSIYEKDIEPLSLSTAAVQV
ncbi:MAG: hypothetical protein LQ338_000096 [Usnochroma carphineum]|nr:MAG: hypothetical protein LQ338_000096 [Usnochroma carphineum]